MRLSRCLLLLSSVILLPRPAFANEARQHDGGFFLRLSPGIGSMSTKASDGVDDLKFSGPSGAFDVAVGFGVKPKLIVHANVGAWSMVDPKLEVSGTEFETEDLTVSLTNFGAGVTYYPGDSNVFVTGSVGLASLNAELDGDSAETGTGLSFEIGAGKEWWVSDKFALGLGAAVNVHSVPDEELDEKFSGTSFGIRLSATFN